MILFLALSVLFTSYLVFAFKIFQRFGVNTFHAIVVNYITCVVTGAVFKGSAPAYGVYAHEGWFPYAVLLGCSFITFFNVMSYVTRHHGITVTSVATKLSMVIPICVAFFLYNETATVAKVIGIVLSLAAVYLTSERMEQSGNSVKSAPMWIPLALFLGSGMNDTIVKHAQVRYLNANTFNDFLTTCFSLAALAGSIALVYDLSVRKSRFSWKAVVAGIVLGVPNYFSIYFLFKALERGDASYIYPVNNIGIVGFSAVIAWLFFKEHLTVKNWIGLGLAVTAIALMSFAW